MNVKVEKWTLLYAVLKIYFKLIHKLFYRKFVVEGLRNIPKDKTIIFAPNHQNAVMDPLAMIFSTPYQIVFLARGDTFKKPAVAKIFYTLKILPIFRQRDGKEALKKNEEIFNISVNVLKHNKPFCLFPEAQHNSVRRLRILKKGIQRIAFQALEETDFKLDMAIIPTGIYYDDKFNSLATLHIQYGKPIFVNDYIDFYKQNPQKATMALRDEMTKRIKPLMIDIQNKEYYELIEFLRDFMNKIVRKNLKLKNNQKSKFKADKFIIEKLEKTAEQNETLMSEIKSDWESLIKLFKTNLKNYENKIYKNLTFFELTLKSLKYIILFPLFLSGLVINFLPYFIIKSVIKKIVKDPQFLSTIKFGAGAILYPVYYSIISIFLIIFLDNVYFILSAILFMPVSAIIAKYYYYFIKKFFADLRFTFLNKTQKTKIIKIQNKIINSVSKITNF